MMSHRAHTALNASRPGADCDAKPEVRPRRKLACSYWSPINKPRSLSLDSRLAIMQTNAYLNSYDEWTRLREVVVGTALNYGSHERELSFELFFHDNLGRRSEWYYP